ncbi:Abi-alpha family protein [Aeromicrobium sp.]|uniref:Abi-alpha family protein n=1 Tax=Aeromicrobium sp. TaxID=1871063 RepID=UPI003D6A4B5C
MADLHDPGPGPDDPAATFETDELAAALRLAASATLQTAGWGVRTYLRTGRRIVDAVTPEPARGLARDLERTARELAAISGVTRRFEEARSSNEVLNAATKVFRSLVAGPLASPPQLGLQSLKESGADLIRRSRDVWNDEQAHPAYERILSELAPDEGRVLMLLLSKGPQPSVDVRTGGPIGILSSHLIAPGLTMIGSRAGLRYTDQVPAYLNNLFRLGLVWFSRETLRDVHQYQVVEAQPDVLEAMHSVRYAKIVRRSIHLTPFGEDFCRACLVLDAIDIANLPKHAQPADDDSVAPPILADS